MVQEKRGIALHSSNYQLRNNGIRFEILNCKTIGALLQHFLMFFFFFALAFRNKITAKNNIYSRTSTQ